MKGRRSIDDLMKTKRLRLSGPARDPYDLNFGQVTASASEFRLETERATADRLTVGLIDRCATLLCAHCSDVGKLAAFRHQLSMINNHTYQTL
ncbi:hypothetical protein R6Q57_014606 [Mikania cordata]